MPCTMYIHSTLVKTIKKSHLINDPGEHSCSFYLFSLLLELLCTVWPINIFIKLFANFLTEFSNILGTHFYSIAVMKTQSRLYSVFVL